MPLIHAELSERIIGCCIRVNKILGPGFPTLDIKRVVLTH